MRFGQLTIKLIAAWLVPLFVLMVLIGIVDAYIESDPIGFAVMGMLVAVFVAIVLSVFAVTTSKRPRPTHPTCSKCGYDLRGNPAATACPECGDEM